MPGEEWPRWAGLASGRARLNPRRLETRPVLPLRTVTLPGEEGQGGIKDDPASLDFEPSEQGGALRVSRANRPARISCCCRDDLDPGAVRWNLDADGSGIGCSEPGRDDPPGVGHGQGRSITSSANLPASSRSTTAWPLSSLST